MPKIDPALYVEQAVRAEVLGRPGIVFQGKMRSSAEIRRMAGEPLFPLSPFNAYQYYMNKSSSRD